MIFSLASSAAVGVTEVGKIERLSWKQGVGSLADQEEGVMIIEYVVVIVTTIAAEAKWIEK